MYRIYVSTERKVIITRAKDVKVTRIQLPLINDLCDLSTFRRSEAKIAAQEDNEEHREAAPAFCMVSLLGPMYYRDDGSIPRIFEEARWNPAWAEAIDQECKALVDGKTRVLVNREPGM